MRIRKKSSTFARFLAQISISMKKTLFQLAVVAVMALPVLMGCEGMEPNPQDNPGVDSTRNPIEIMEEWLFGVDSLMIPVSEDALIGCWRELFMAEMDVDSIRPNNWNIPDSVTLFTPVPGLSWEIKSDHTCKVYDFTVEDGVSLVRVNEYKWALEDSVFSLSWGWTYPTGETYTDASSTDIMYMQENRYVCSEFIRWEDMQRDFRLYRGYSRCEQLPALPKNPVERLTDNEWRVVADTMKVYRYYFVQIDENTSEARMDTLETKYNQLVPSGLFSFNNDGVFIIKNASGEVIGQYQWLDMPNNEPTYRTLYLVAEKNDLNLDTYLTFNPNLHDASKGGFYTAFYSEDSQYYYEYFFGVEAVK